MADTLPAPPPAEHVADPPKNPLLPPPAAPAPAPAPMVEVKIEAQPVAAAAVASSAPAAAAPARAASKPFTATRDAPLYLLLNPLIWVLWLLDFLAWLLIAIVYPPWMLKWLQYSFFGTPNRSFSHIDFTSDVNSQFRTRRKVLHEHAGGGLDLKTAPFGPGCPSTVHAVMQKAFRDYASLPCMGTREYVKMHKADTERFPRKVFGDTAWKTYAEVAAEAQAFGAGLRRLGMQPMPLDAAQSVTQAFAPLAGPHALVLYEDTCAAWTTACLGALGQSLTVVTSYATLGLGAVAEALNQTAAPVLLCNYNNVAKVAAFCDSACPQLTHVVYTRHAVERDQPSLAPTMGRIQVLDMADVVALGVANPIPFCEPTPDHVGLIMYTSGSTGKPKGVMLKHSAIVASVAGLEDYFLTELSARATCAEDQETYLAYLPAAHILEFSAEMSMLVHGAKLGFSDPKTIGSAGAYRLMPDGSLNGEATGTGNFPPGGIQEFAPTCMAAVPKIWDILKKGVEDKLSKGGAVGQALFQAAFSARSRALQQGRESPLLGLLFKKKVGAALGGRVKVAVTGGGPISADVQNFIRVAMHFNLVQGYGLTETCSAGTLQPADSTRDGVAGSPVSCLRMRLADCAKKEADGSYCFLDREKKPYLSTDKTHYGQRCLGRGEVWIKGDNLSSGYYGEEAMTRKEFDREGWFHTGDVGIWTPIGTLKIVDRLKNLVKLKGGEYVAIEAMEATYAQSVFVDGKNGGLLCYGDGDMDKPVALVQVNGAELKNWARAHGVSFASLDELCAHPQAQAAVLADLNAQGRGKLGLNEALAAVALLPGTGAPDAAGPDAPWSSENGYLTAANKLARNQVLEGFQAAIDAIKPLAIR